MNRTHRFGFCMVDLFRKIDEDFGGSMSWNTQPKFFVSLTMATALFLPFFFDLLLGCSSTVCEDALRALFPNFASIFCLVKQALEGMPLFTRWIRTSTLKMFLARLTRYFPRRTFLLGLFDIAKIFPPCACVVCSGLGVGCVVAFARLFLTCRKLHWSPFVHCPLACHCDVVPSDS